MPLDAATIRAGFEQGAHSFMAAVRAVPDDRWDRPGALGEWTMRELVAHTVRAFVTTAGYLNGPVINDNVLTDPADYYRVGLSAPDVHQGVFTRARQAARQLHDPLGECEQIVRTTLATVAASADDDAANTFAGRMALIDYLCTRVVEVGVHTLDMQRALGLPPELHPDTSAVILDILIRRGDAVATILALTGRASLPAGYNVLD